MTAGQHKGISGAPVDGTMADYEESGDIPGQICIFGLPGIRRWQPIIGRHSAEGPPDRSDFSCHASLAATTREKFGNENSAYIPP